MAKVTKRTANAGPFRLEIPLDASGVEGFKPDLPIKVAVQDRKGALQSQQAKLDAKGTGKVAFTFSGDPGPLRVAVGPADATDEELFGLQTLQFEVPVRRWLEPRLVLPPVRIPPYHWHWWRRWCRNFVVRGRVLCSDGRPVPGARVCAYDVDAWWWWSSRQLVGCDTTDATGSFEIAFRWCCGWWPWWWWRARVWELDPHLVEKIHPRLARDPVFRRIPLPDPTPDLAIFEHLLGEDEVASLNLTRHAVLPKLAAPATEMKASGVLAADLSAAVQPRVAIDPAVMADLRDRLVARLPRLPELEQLHLWPWWPWQPWWDCTPDIVFRVTQDCNEPGTVIVDEGYGATRWNIPTSLDVTLLANRLACCLSDQDDEPEGKCALLSNVCDNPINLIGGNPGAAAAPVGYLSPGAVSNYGDRPYGGRVLVQGQVGSAVDYYEFERSDDGGATWHDLPAASVGDIPRRYWIPTTNTFQAVPFLTTVDARLVFESRQHYEATHDPLSWGVTRFWMADNYLSLLNWQTATPFLNGTYRLRVKGWELVAGHLANPQILPTCSVATPAGLVLRIDNRLEGAASGHPIGDPNHPCGTGTVHTCTLEPDTDFLGVRIVHADGSPPTPVGACGNVPVSDADTLQVDFLAHDPEGHLAYYTLQATYGENLAVNLLSLPGVSLTPLGGGPVPPAAQVGPGYVNARSALAPPLGGAAAPIWRGGAIRLEVPARQAFPETCCYQLELRAHKRTIVGCNHSLWNHTNYSEFSFMVVV